MSAPLTERDYRALPAVSWTRYLKPFVLHSPAHARYSIEHGGIDTDSRAFLNAVHCLSLRPDDFDGDFFVLPEGVDRGTINRALDLYGEDRSPDMMPTDIEEKDAAWLLAHGHVSGPEDFVVDDQRRGTNKFKAAVAALPHVNCHIIKSKILDAAMVRAENMRTAASIGERLIITAKEHTRAQHIADAVRSHPMVAAILARPDCLTEQALVWEDPTHGRCKGKADIVIPGVATIDLKTYRSDEPSRVAADIPRNAWGAQLAWYEAGTAEHFNVDMTGAARVTVIAVEHGGDYGPRGDVPGLVTVGWFEHSPAMRMLADKRLGDALEELARCRETGIWPQPTPPEGVVVDPPRWAVVAAGLDPEEVLSSPLP